MSGWDLSRPGVLVLPSGRRVLGRSLREPQPDGPRPELGLYLLARPPEPLPWETRWLRWPEFGLPVDPSAARAALVEAWTRAADERVEIACRGGRGRTGSALACLAVLDGVAPEDAVRYVRRRHHPRAVETPWQRRYVARFAPP